MKQEDFDEEAYLEAHADVARAVAKGNFKSGWDHYIKAGRADGRAFGNSAAGRRIINYLDGRQLFFCHIPKTAGTSLSRAFENSLQPHQILPDDRMIQRCGGSYPPADVLPPMLKHVGKDIWLMRGHYHLSFRQFMRDPMTVAVLRSPRNRVISHLKHVVGRHGQTRESVLATLDHGVLPIPDNLMVRYLGGKLHDGNTPCHVQNHQLLSAKMSDPAARLASALENLNTIQLLGITEDLESLRDQIKAMGFSFDAGAKLNKAVVDLPLTDGHLNLIEEKSRLDIELYQAAKKLLDERKPH